MQSQTFCRATNSDRIKLGTLQKHSACSSSNFGILSAHDPRQCDRIVSVTDQEIVLAQLSLYGIECNKLLNASSLAHDYLAAGQTIEVEGMERLTALEHHVVRYVDNVID